MKLKANESDRETAMRVHGSFVDACPVYRTLKPAIEITTELHIETEADDFLLGDQGQKGG